MATEGKSSDLCTKGNFASSFRCAVIDILSTGAQPDLCWISPLLVPFFFRERIIREEAAKEKVFLLDLGYRKAGFPGRFWDLYLQAVKGFRKKLSILLTNLKISESRKDLWRTAESNLVL